MNRRAIDLTADLLFAPTAHAKANLAAERLPGRIVLTGNTVVDALRATRARIAADASLRTEIAQSFAHIPPEKRIVLVTAHRREKLGPGLERLCTAILALAARPDVAVVFPVHLNPNVRATVLDRLGGHPSIHLMEPFDYGHFVAMLDRAAVILTDSGGVQEEGTALGRPVLVTRDATERPGAIAAGTARLVGTDPDRILAAAALLTPARPRGGAEGQSLRRRKASLRIVDAPSSAGRWPSSTPRRGRPPEAPDRRPDGLR